jgi:hypothetical protein
MVVSGLSSRGKRTDQGPRVAHVVKLRQEICNECVFTTKPGFHLSPESDFAEHAAYLEADNLDGFSSICGRYDNGWSPLESLVESISSRGCPRSGILEIEIYGKLLTRQLRILQN